MRYKWKILRKSSFFSGMDLDDTLKGTLEGMGLGILDKNDSGLEKRLQALSTQIA